MSNLLAFVIEDDPSLSAIFCEAVRQAGFNVETCQDGMEAVLRFARPGPPPDLIVLDLHLPQIDGTELLYRIHALPGYARAILIIASADPQMADAYAEQADFVLIKPISYIQLRDLCKRIAQKKLGIQP